MNVGGPDVEIPVLKVRTPILGDEGIRFEALYNDEHARQVRRAALLTGSSETAHDIVHDAFVEVLQRWDRLREPAPYLSRAVVNGCRDRERRRATEVRCQSALVERGAPPEDVRLLDALGRLPFNHRAVVVLRFYLQYQDREIADLLGCRPGSVGPWLQRGLRALRKELT
jgi:RNA polymerase sigma-70 factor (ECF subfamily)